MNYFLVDYENVNVSGFDGLVKLSDEDVVIIFYSENAETMTFGLHKRINESKATVNFQKVSAKTKNALDFQLCSYLGYLIRDKMNNSSSINYYIVSNDVGYSVLSDYWKHRAINVKLVSNLKTDPPKSTAIVKQTQSTKTSTNESSKLEKMLSGIVKKSDIAAIEKIIHESKEKKDIHNKLVQKFGAQKGGDIYRKIKSLK